MEVHICTFHIKLTTVQVKVAPRSSRQSLEAVWRGEKGQIIVVGAVRSLIKNGLATFNEIFEIKTDLIRDPISSSYLPSSLVLQIRNAGQALNEKISNSVCKLGLSDILNSSQLVVAQLQTQDKGFVAHLEVQCLQIINSGLRKSTKKLEKKLSTKDKQNSQAEPEINQLQRTSIYRSKEGKSRSRSRERLQNEQDFYKKCQQQISKLKQQLNSEQANHIITSQALRNAHIQLMENEHVVNQLSALISQRETDIFQLNQKLDNSKEELEKLKEQNINIKITLKELDLLEVKNFQLQQHILECQREIEELKQEQKQGIEKEKQLKSNASKEKEINIFLSKSLDQLKKDLGRKQEELSSLSAINKANDQDRAKTKEQLRLLKEKYTRTQSQLKEDLSQNNKKFNQLYAKYSKLKDQNSDLSSMVSYKQMRELQRSYQEKLLEFQQKQLALKEHVDGIDRQMAELEDLLEEKEQNQVKLIEHSRKLQLEIDRLGVQKTIWANVFPKEQFQDVENRAAGQECLALKNKVNRLLLILKENSSIFLQSEKNKRQLHIIQKEQKQTSQRLALIRDQSKQLKERVTVLLKENKKLIEKMHKIQKQNQSLMKNTHHLTKQLKIGQQKQKVATQDYQILNYRMNLLQKQLNQLKSSQKNQTFLKQNTQNFSVKSIDGESGMYMIRQISQQFVSSRPQSGKGFQHQKQEVKYFHPQFLHEISTVLMQRQQIAQHLFPIIEKNTGNRLFKLKRYQQLNKQSIQLGRLITQVKRFLVIKGQKDVVNRCELQLRKILEEVNKLQIEDD